MDAMTRRLLAAQMAVTLYVSGMTERLRGDDRGQASTEYAGVLFVIVALIAVVAAAMDDTVGTAVRTKIVQAINEIKGK